MLCPACHAANPAGVQFCKHCHATLFFRCPHCWHEQAKNRICEKCGLDLDNFWRAQVATAEIIQIKEDADERERNLNLRDGMRASGLPPAEILPAALAFTLPGPLGLLLGVAGQWIIARIRRWLFD